MIAEHKGPIVLSASIHFVGVLALFIASLILPNKAPEPFEFVMYGDPGAQVSNSLPQLETLSYEVEDVPMPDPELFKPEIPEPEPVVEVVPEPIADPVELVQKIVEPVPEVVPDKPNLMSYKDFGEVKEQNVRKNPVRTSKPVDLSSVNRDLQKMIASARSTTGSMSSGDERSFEAYLNTLAATIRDAVEIHTAGRVPLVVEVRFLLAANGSVTGARIHTSSGDRIFDQKVLAAFKSPSVRYFRETPFGKSHELILPVRQQD
tara:strand:- start:508 stop:1293 length:786 start_codon:yes stop_codon:yes gene_type:complete